MTFDQKFILLLSVDKFFKDECQFVREAWELPKNEMVTSTKESQQDDLPIQYKKDIQFILYQSILPQRYFWPLHQYVLFQKIPKIKDLPSSVRVFLSNNPTADIGKVVIEVDIDAGKKEIMDVFKEIYESRTMLQKISRTNKTFQPIRNFDEFLKRAKNRSLDSLIDFDDFWKVGVDGKTSDLSAMRKIAKGMKNKWRVQIFRSKKTLTKGKRTSVKDRESWEESLKNIEVPW
jgi:ribosomal protein L23